MDRKIDAGAVLVAAAAVLLVVSEFLDWFGLAGASGVSAWDVFEVLDLVLLAAAVTVVAAAFGRLDSRVGLVAAAVATVVVVSQLIQPPPAAGGADREVGAWLALVASLALLAGAALIAAQIAVTVDVRGRERRRRVATVDKRTQAPATPVAAPGAAGATAPGAPGPEAPVATPGAPGEGDDRFAPRPSGGSAAIDPDATQAFDAPKDEPER